MSTIHWMIFAVLHPITAINIVGEKKNGSRGFYELRRARYSVFWPLGERAQHDAETDLHDRYSKWWGGWRVPNEKWREVHKHLRDHRGHCMVSDLFL